MTDRETVPSFPPAGLKRFVAAAVLAASAVVIQVQPGVAQSFGQACVRVSQTQLPEDRAAASYARSKAQRLMNEIARETATRPQTVAGAFVFKNENRVAILWIKGEFICNDGSNYDRVLFDRIERTVFGVEI